MLSYSLVLGERGNEQDESAQVKEPRIELPSATPGNDSEIHKSDWPAWKCSTTASEPSLRLERRAAVVGRITSSSACIVNEKITHTLMTAQHIAAISRVASKSRRASDGLRSPTVLPIRAGSMSKTCSMSTAQGQKTATASRSIISKSNAGSACSKVASLSSMGMCSSASTTSAPSAAWPMLHPPA